MSKLSGHTCGYFYAILFQDNLNVQKNPLFFCCYTRSLSFRALHFSHRLTMPDDPENRTIL